ncbi:MAG: hypothetical protein M1308_09160 [Actinobacteria bacterium]|nr:hypothetical protein [Actinomycetota bacterium]
MHLIGKDGGLRHIPPYLAPKLMAQGFRRVDNPKRTYYPEYDLTNPHYKKEIIDEEETDILLVTKL